MEVAVVVVVVDYAMRGVANVSKMMEIAVRMY